MECSAGVRESENLWADVNEQDGSGFVGVCLSESI